MAQASTHYGLTPAQSELISDLDDVAEHVAWEFDPDEYQGISTIGFAHIHGIDGNGSFMARVRSCVKSGQIEYITELRNGGYQIQISGLELHITKSHSGGYRASVTNVRSFKSGPEHQRLDVRERLNRLVLDRLQQHGYLNGAFVRSRMD